MRSLHIPVRNVYVTTIIIIAVHGGDTPKNIIQVVFKMGGKKNVSSTGDLDTRTSVSAGRV